MCSLRRSEEGGIAVEFETQVLNHTEYTNPHTHRGSYNRGIYEARMTGTNDSIMRLGRLLKTPILATNLLDQLGGFASNMSGVAIQKKESDQGWR